MAFGQEALTRSGRPRSQNSSSRHAKPPFATRVARSAPVLDSSDMLYNRLRAPFQPPRTWLNRERAAKRHGDRYPTNPTMTHTRSPVPPIRRRLRRQAPTDLCYQPHQIVGPQMEHLFRAPLQSPAHRQHLARGVDADQITLLPQAMAERLLTHREAFGPRQLLGHLIAGGGLQEQVAPRHPTDSGAPAVPTSGRHLGAASPTPSASAGT